MVNSFSSYQQNSLNCHHPRRGKNSFKKFPSSRSRSKWLFFSKIQIWL